MAQLPVPRTEIISRLKKIEGQIRGIETMVQDERDCVDVLVQLAAAKSALQSVAGQVLRNYTSICLAGKSTDEIGKDLAHAVSLLVGGRG